MKILVIALESAASAPLLQDESLAVVRSLMEAGCYGTVAGESAADRFNPSTFMDFARSSGLAVAAEPFNACRFPDRMSDEPWDFAHLVHAGESLADLDVALGAILEGLADDALVLIAAEHAFVLAGTQLPPFGLIDGVRGVDLPATLLALADLPPLPGSDGRNILEGREASAGDPVDDDELVRERLRGLGYIG